MSLIRNKVHQKTKPRQLKIFLHICSMRFVSVLVSVLITFPFLVSGQGIISKTIQIENNGPVIPLPAVDRKSTENLTVLFTNGRLLASTDAGETWSDEMLKNPEQANDGWMFSNKRGDLFYFTKNSGQGLNVTSSSDGGQTWKSLGSLELPGILGYPSLFFDPDKDRVMITYLKEEDDCAVELIFIQSSNAKKWTEPVRLNGEDISCSGAEYSNGGITLGPQGYLFAAWSHDGVIYLDRSYNDGEKWLRSDIAIHPRKGSGITGKPGILSDNSQGLLSRALYVMWADSLESGYDILVSRTTNNGDFWTQPSRVHSGESSDLRAPQISIDQSNGFLYALYYERVENGGYDLFIALSDDGAQNFDHLKLNEGIINIPDERWLPILARMDVFEGKVVVSWSSISGNEQKVWARSLTFDQILK